MPEDQGVNGNQWTNEASKLLLKLGWEKIADSNVDIPGSDGLMHGIDALFKYFDGFYPAIEQGVFLEAKRYETENFRPGKLNDWINCFDKKIRELKTSAKFYETYPIMENTRAINGFLALWFHDLENYNKFYPNFNKALLSVKTPKGRSGIKLMNRLFVIENHGILRISSLIDAVEKINNSMIEIADFKFVYPSSAGFGYPIHESVVLNFEYIFSKFILGKAVDKSKNTIDVVFYFGDLNMISFQRLKQALLSHNMLSSHNSLYLFHYKREDEFRKIRLDVEHIFKQDGPEEVTFKTMEKFSDLPSWVKD